MVVFSKIVTDKICHQSLVGLYILETDATQVFWVVTLRVMTVEGDGLIAYNT